MLNRLKSLVKFPVRNEKRPRTSLQGANESFGYDGLGNLDIKIKLTPERRAEFEARLKELTDSRDRSLKTITREHSDYVRLADRNRDAAMEKLTVSFDKSRLQLFLDFQRTAERDVVRDVPATAAEERATRRIAAGNYSAPIADANDPKTSQPLLDTGRSDPDTDTTRLRRRRPGVVPPSEGEQREPEKVTG